MTERDMLNREGQYQTRLNPDRRAYLSERLVDLQSMRRRGIAESQEGEKHIALGLLEHFQSHVIYEDDDVLVIDKPGNARIHPADEESIGVLEIAQFHKGNLAPTYMLDKETSGALVLARNQCALDSLRSQFEKEQNPRVKSIYGALLDGEMDLPGGPIAVNELIRRSMTGRIKVVRFKADSFLNEENNIRVNAIFNPIAYMEARGKQDKVVRRSVVEIETAVGKPLYVRAIASLALNFPIVGDRRFNTSYDTDSFPRHMLHVLSTTFRHPRTHEIITPKRAPAPDDFGDVLKNHIIWS